MLDVPDDQPQVRSAMESKFREILPEYEWKELAASDGVLSAVHKIDNLGKVKVLGNGFRNLVYFPAESWSCAWNLYKVEDQKAKFQFVENLLEVNSGGEELRRWFAAPTYEIGAQPDRDIAVLYSETGSTTPAYPSAVGALDRLMQANFRVHVTPAGSDASTKPVMMWVSVAGKEPMKAEVGKQIMDHLNGGGFVMADVVSGNVNWAEQLHGDLRKLDSSITLKRLRQSDPMFTGEIPGTQGFDVRRAHFRKALRTRFIERGPCELYGLMKEDVMVGVVSNYDLVSGLGYHQFPECRGLMPDDARQLAMNGVLYAMHKDWARRQKTASAE